MRFFHLGSRYEAAAAVVLIVLTGILSYGLLVNQLGYYRDDWYLVWTAQSLGPEGIFSLFMGDRPFLGWLYLLDFNILGTSHLAWHIYALVLRVAGTLAFWWLIRILWPQKRLETTTIALLFLVYPGFFQQPNAMTFNMLLLAYAAAMLSIALTLCSIPISNRSLKYALVALAVILAVFYLYIYEALIGLEVVRLVLLWYALRRHRPLPWKNDLLRLLKLAWPYLLLAGGFLFWRLFLFDSTRRATSVDILVSGYEAVPLHGFLFVLIESIKDWFEMTFFAWSVPFYQFIGGFRYREVLTAFGIASLGVLLFFLYRRFTAQTQNIDTPDSPLAERDWIWLGAFIIIITTAPIILAGRNVVFSVQWDRYTFQSLAGVALILGGIIFYSLRGSSRWMLIGALLTLGLMTQYFSGAYYRDFWSAERSLWWQLAWRASGIRKGSTVVASLPADYQFAEEYEVWGPLNLIYSPGEAVVPIAGQIPFSGIEVELERGTVEDRLVRGTALVNRDYGQSVIASLPTISSCLHVIDGTNPRLSLSEPDRIALIARFSKIELLDIEASPITPNPGIFGAEPAHEWCYFYQKISLALHGQDWPEAARLADESLSADFRPIDQSEWLVIMEAYIRNGQVKEARQASKFITDHTTRTYLCQQLRSSQAGDGEYPTAEVLELLCGGGD